MSNYRNFRRRISYFPTFLSITLVLFLAGLFGLFIMHANALKEKAKENVQMNIYFKDNVRDADIKRMEQMLDNEAYVKDAVFVTKEEALEQWQRDMGEDPQALLGFNPFPNSIDVHFSAGFVSVDSLDILKTKLEKNVSVREVTFDKVVVENIDRNVRVVGLILLSIAALMAVVSIALIHNTIRLTLYSKRFIIKSMQLVGATRNFIRRPFILKGLMLGLLSSLFACALLVFTLYVLNLRFVELEMLQDYEQIIIIMFGIIVLGMFISGISSLAAVNKYLKVKLDNLF